MERHTADEVAAAYARLGRGLPEALARAQAAAALRLSAAELARWETAALEVGLGAHAPYAAAGAFLAVAEPVLAALGLHRFLEWAATGRSLQRESDALGAAFFTTTPALLLRLP